MSGPQVLDRDGAVLEVGSRAKVFPNTANPDETLVTGFKQDWLGWRVEHSWLTGYHPDEPEPSEPTTYVTGVGLICLDLLITTAKEKN